jgi:hypothetical protein
MFIFARAIFHLRFSAASSRGTRAAPFKFAVQGASKGFF